VSDQKQEPGPGDPLYYAPRWIRERNDPSDRTASPYEADRKSRSAAAEGRSAPAEGIPPPDAIAHGRHGKGRDPHQQKQPDIFAEAVARAERQLREPVFVDPPPHLQERASIGIAAKFAVAMSVAILIALSFVVALPSSQGRVEDSALAGLPTWQSLKASLFAATQHKAAPTLIVRDSSGLVNEPLRLGIVVEDFAPGASVTIRKMPTDARLTAGKRIGPSEWRVAAQDVSDAALIPPADFVGGLILSAELRGADGVALVATFFSLTWTTPPTARNLAPSANAAAAPPAAVAAAPQQAVAPPPAATVASAAPSTPILPAATLPAANLPAPDTPAAASTTADSTTAASPPADLPAPAATARTEPGQGPSPNEIAGFVRRAQELLASGDMPGARSYLTRAAEAHDARAALLLAKTFDPMVSRHQSGADQGPDVAQARDWYQKAREWGAPEAQRQLDALASYPRK
jgi:hypothetical protein